MKASIVASRRSHNHQNSYTESFSCGCEIKVLSFVGVKSVFGLIQGLETVSLSWVPPRYAFEASILWGQMKAFAQWPNNETEAIMAAECAKQTPWQIAMKLHNRLAGPDNTLMTQVKANQYSNSTFMATKDMVMARIFQLIMVQSLCLGVEYGPNYNITNDWQMARMYAIYSDIVNITISSRIAQETDYFLTAVPDIVNSIVVTNDGSKLQGYADQLYSTLSNLYGWDHFGVAVKTPTYSGDQPGRSGYRPVSIQYIKAHDVQDVYIVRYWVNLKAKKSFSPQLQQCLDDSYDGNYQTWAQQTCDSSCDLDFVMMTNPSWAHYAPAYTTAVPDSSNYVSNLGNHGASVSAVVGAPHRPSSVQYDLGFWERPIKIKLTPY